MKKLIVLLFLCSFISCASIDQIDQKTLATSNGGRSGVVILDNGDYMYFKSSFVILTLEKVIIVNEDIRHEFLWRKIRTIHIYNTTKQEEYIEELKKIEKITKGK